MHDEEKIQLLKERYGGDFCECQYRAIDNGSTTPLHIYVSESEFELVKKAISEGAEVNARDYEGQTPLFRIRDIGILKFLFKNGADVSLKDYENNTPLHHNSNYEEDLEVAKFFIKQGSDINAVNDSGRTAYDLSCLFRNHKLMTIYKSLNAATGPRLNKLPGLHKAVICNDLNLAKEMLQKGESPNIRCEDNTTPLHWASCAEMADILITSGAEIDAKDSDGDTPLSESILLFEYEIETYELAKLLLSKGADANVRDKDGWSLLHFCSSFKIAELLIEYGADVNMKGDDGYTPLHCAVEDEVMGLNEDAKLIIELLISKGAKADIVNSEGKTPLDIAVEENIEGTIINLLSRSN